MVRCSSQSCSNSSDSGSHRWLSFPENEGLKNKWTDAMGNQNWKPTKYSVLCASHFGEDSWDGHVQSKLKPEAVPSLFCRCKEEGMVQGKPSALKDHNYITVAASTPVKPRILQKRSIKVDKENDGSVLKKKVGRPKCPVEVHVHSCPFYVNHFSSLESPSPNHVSSHKSPSSSDSHSSSREPPSSAGIQPPPVMSACVAAIPAAHCCRPPHL